MFGTKLFKQITGCWDVIGYLSTNNITIPSGVTMPKGTTLSQIGDTLEAQLASGLGIGYTTQDVDNEGNTSDAAFKARSIRGADAIDLPIKKGQNVTLRRPHAGSEIEVEGLGAAAVGNLLCTSGTGAISTATAAKTALAFFNGALRVAQTGDFVQGIMLVANLTPQADAGNVRVRYRVIEGYIKA
jgi:hypothetical protein